MDGDDDEAFSGQVLGRIAPWVAVREHLTLEEHDDGVRFKVNRHLDWTNRKTDGKMRQHGKNEKRRTRRVVIFARGHALEREFKISKPLAIVKTGDFSGVARRERRTIPWWAR